MVVNHDSCQYRPIYHFFLYQVSSELILVQMSRFTPVLLREVSHMEVEVPNRHFSAFKYQ